MGGISERWSRERRRPWALALGYIALAPWMVLFTFLICTLIVTLTGSGQIPDLLYGIGFITSYVMFMAWWLWLIVGIVGLVVAFRSERRRHPLIVTGLAVAAPFVYGALLTLLA